MEKSRIVRQFGNVAIANVAKLIYSVLDKKGVEEALFLIFIILSTISLCCDISKLSNSHSVTIFDSFRYCCYVGNMDWFTTDEYLLVCLLPFALLFIWQCFCISATAARNRSGHEQSGGHEVPRQPHQRAESRIRTPRLLH